MVKLGRVDSCLLVGLVMLLTGCAAGPRLVMPTPNVYVETERDVDADLAEPLRNNEVPLFYITDRTPEQDDEGNLRYGSGRSSSLAYGSAVVDLGVDITWDELLEASPAQSRLKPVELELREVLGFIASFPEVEKIHLIAHSRGTDVAIAAVRELTLLARGAGIDPRQKYKIHNLVLAAPDLDVQVASQRIAGDMLELSVGRFTVYTSPADKAIGIAQMLFQSPRGRIGTLGMGEVDEAMKARLEYDRRKQGRSNLAIVQFAGAADAPNSQRDRYGHSYFRDVPTVSSDPVLLLRDDLDPGTPGRPLEPI